MLRAGDADNDRLRQEDGVQAPISIVEVNTHECCNFLTA